MTMTKLIDIFWKCGCWAFFWCQKQKIKMIWLFECQHSGNKIFEKTGLRRNFPHAWLMLRRSKVVDLHCFAISSTLSTGMTGRVKVYSLPKQRWYVGQLCGCLTLETQKSVNQIYTVNDLNSDTRFTTVKLPCKAWGWFLLYPMSQN